MPIALPFPTTLEHVIWMGIGLAFGRGFGKQLDQEIQATDWFKAQHPMLQMFLKRILDTLHHWWMGGLLMVYWTGPIYWFGFGLLIDDIPDVPPRLLSFLTGWSQYLGNSGEPHE